jgi:Chaperone of endosialidase
LDWSVLTLSDLKHGKQIKQSEQNMAMKNPNQPTKTTDPARNPFNRSPWWRAFVVVATVFAVACFAFSPPARAVCQEGCLNNENTVLGEDALLSLTTGTQNVALGYDALQNTTSGLNNTATGHSALASNTAGFNNTAHGWHALIITTGNQNTGVGCDALVNNTTGSNNIAVGFRAGVNLTSGSNNIDIGSNGVGGESNTIRIGNIGAQSATFVAGVRGVAVAGAQQVGVSPSGQLGVRASSARFKEAISSMDKASETILALHPVSFRYKKEFDPKGVPQFGLVAEEVAKVNPDLVVPDEEGKPFSVRYEEVSVMLLNEFLKEHRIVQEQGATIAELKKEIANLTAAVKEQAAQIQKVSAQIEVSKPASRTVLNNQ